MIAALRTARGHTARSLEIIRMIMLALILFGWLMYPVELVIIGHWLDSWQSWIPFFISVPGIIFTVWVMFDRRTPWVRWAFIITMWLAVITGIAGAYFHLLGNMEGDIAWTFEHVMEAFHGWAPTLAALAYTNMGVTGLAAIYRAR